MCLKSPCTVSTAQLALIEVQGLLRQILQGCNSFTWACASRNYASNYSISVCLLTRTKINLSNNWFNNSVNYLPLLNVFPARLSVRVYSVVYNSEKWFEIRTWKSCKQRWDNWSSELFTQFITPKFTPLSFMMS